MKSAFVYCGLYQSFEEQFGYNAIPNLPNSKLHSFWTQNCQYNVTQLKLTDSYPAAQ